MSGARGAVAAALEEPPAYVLAYVPTLVPAPAPVRSRSRRASACRRTMRDAGLRGAT